MLPAMMTSLALPDRRVLRVDLYPRVTAKDQHSKHEAESYAFIPLPDFITSARRELMESAVFFAFLVGAIFAYSRLLGDLEYGG